MLLSFKLNKTKTEGVKYKISNGSGCEVQETKEVFDRIRKYVEKHPIDTDVGKVSITISIGITSLQDDVDEMIKYADEAMYHAKKTAEIE